MGNANNEGINVLSLFDGMSCGAIALRQAGIKVKQYFASEIDRYAIRQTAVNFPATIQLGCVTGVHAENLPYIDLLIGGSPCQGFSFAGKQLNFNDPRSSLFFEFVRVFNEIRRYNPEVKFLLENVRMRKEYENVISEQLGLFPVEINSSLVSAQNRIRLYWTNICTRTEVDLFYTSVYTDIPQPEDRGIYLSDILEDNVDEKYYFTQSQIQKLLKKQIEYGSIEPDEDIKSEYCGLFDYDDAEDTRTGANMDFTDLCLAFRGRFNPVTGRNEQHPEVRFDGKTNSLTTVQKDNLLISRNIENCPRIVSGSIVSAKFGVGFRPIKSGKNAGLKGRARNDGNGQCVCMIVNGDEDVAIRRLTPKECCRLQTVPEWYEWVCGDAQIYRMLGNGWTVDVISHIFQYLSAG